MASQFDSFSETKSSRHLSVLELSGNAYLSVIFSIICNASEFISKLTEILSPAICPSIKTKPSRSHTNSLLSSDIRLNTQYKVFLKMLKMGDFRVRFSGMGYSFKG